MPTRIGVISDTHGLLRPEAMTALQGVDLILHLGDVGDQEILDALKTIAPVHAVRGNVDTHGACAHLPEYAVVEIDGCSIYLLHNLALLDLDPRAAGFSAVLYGHTHQPAIEMKNAVLYFNPGSAGPRRFNLPVTLGYLTVSGGKLEARLHSVL